MRTPTTNWRAARAYWMALEPGRRTYQAVATRFHVSKQRVSEIARREDWKAALDELEELRDVEEQRAIRDVVRRQARSRGERLARTLELYDRALDLGLELLPIDPEGKLELPEGEKPTVEQILARIPRLFRMAELAAGEATERVEINVLQTVLLQTWRVAIAFAPAERRGELLEALEGAAEGLLAIPVEASNGEAP